MAQCFSCGSETNMERPAVDVRDGSAKKYLEDHPNSGYRHSGYVPICLECSKQWDEDRPSGSVSSGGTLSAPPHSTETDARTRASDQSSKDKDK